MPGNVNKFPASAGAEGQEPAGQRPPVAATEPVSREMHGMRWIDEYAWMRTSGTDGLLPYLHAERAYYDRAVEHDAHLRERLFAELKRRLLPTDESVRCRRGDKFYYTRTVAGSDYEQFLSSRDVEAPGTVLVDGADFATAAGYVAFGQREVSPDGRILAYSADLTGDEVYSLRFRDLVTLRDLRTDSGTTEEIARTYYGGAWSADSRTFFYVVHDDLYRPHQVWRHRLGSEPSTDDLVFTEPDVRFDVHASATRSGAFVVIESASLITSEVFLIGAGSPTAAPVSVAGRRAGVLYKVDHGADPHGCLVVVTNRDEPEFSVMGHGRDVRDRSGCARQHGRPAGRFRVRVTNAPDSHPIADRTPGVLRRFPRHRRPDIGQAASRADV
jgi:oligopeptidase B